MKNGLLRLLLLSAFPVLAETNAPSSFGPPTGWSTMVQGGALHHFETDLEGGGGFSVGRYYLEGGLAYLFRADRMVSFSVGCGQDDYSFSGVAAEPWNNIENYRASLFTRWALDDKWVLFVVPSIRSYRESGVSLDESMSAAIFGGASYRFGDRLTLGPGLGVVGQIEDDPRYFPVLIVDWKITERLSLGTGGGLASTAGPGLTLSYKASRHWSYELATRYESKRFRLDSQGIAPNGVGEDQNMPLLGGISYQLYPGTSLSGIFGYNFGEKIRLEDHAGKYIGSSDADPAPFFGFVCRIRM